MPSRVCHVKLGPVKSVVSRIGELCLDEAVVSRLDASRRG